jgi:drug/metabolite transporter (DMT)-like permease
VLVSYTIGLLALTIVALVRGESLPPPDDILWGAASGLAGVVGVGLLLRGFSEGQMGIVAPVSAVLAASIPVIVAALTEGLPGILPLVGFGVALAGLWLLSRPQPAGSRPGGLRVALLSGAGFGAFFVALDQVGSTAVFWPLAAGRLAGLVVLLPLVLARYRPIPLRGAPLRLLILAGVLDASGNLFFLLATQAGRLDIAAVLASLYPAVTALLAWLIAGEHMTRSQVTGAAAAILAIVLITI